MQEQAVILRFKCNAVTLEKLLEIEDVLSEYVEEHNLGEYDGYDVPVTQEECFFYFYGPDAEAVFASLQTFFRPLDVLPISSAVIRKGPPEDGVVQREVFF